MPAQNAPFVRCVPSLARHAGRWRCALWMLAAMLLAPLWGCALCQCGAESGSRCCCGALEDAGAANVVSQLVGPPGQSPPEGGLVDRLNIPRPSNNRDWSPDQAVLARAEIHGNEVTVRNIRNCDYRTADEFAVHYYDKTFNLDDVDEVDFIVVPFQDVPGIAHTMLSFGFHGRDYLAVSVEIRREKGETYNPLKGVLGQYELMYVVGDERDLIGLRTNHRLEDVYVYRTIATPQQARALLLDVMERVNKLADEPEFYDTVANNCTTNIRRHVNQLKPDRVPYDYRVALPGLSDRLAYDLGLLYTEDSFEQTRDRSRVNNLAYVYREDPAFSVKIRQPGAGSMVADSRSGR